LVQLWLLIVRDDRGPSTVPCSQGEDETRGNRQTCQGGSREVFAQVQRGCQKSMPTAVKKEPEEQAGLQVWSTRGERGETP